MLLSSNAKTGNRRPQASLRPQCGIARLTIIYFLNLSPVNAKLTSPSYVHASPQTVVRLKIVINVRRMAYATVTVDLRKTKPHDEMTEIFQCYKLPVNKVNFCTVILRNCKLNDNHPCNVRYVAHGAIWWLRMYRYTIVVVCHRHRTCPKNLGVPFLYWAYNAGEWLLMFLTALFRHIASLTLCI